MGFSAGFWRYVPTLFVSVGLFLTFLGLVSALESIVPAKGEVIGSDQLGTLLSVASAKFIMSLTGLLCSILFTLVLRIGIARAEAASHQVANEIESRLSFISLEYLAIEQLTKSAEATARSAADALAAAQAVLASKAKAVEATLDGVSVIRKLTGRQGRDIDGGEAKLDLEFLHEAVREKRVHRFWVLTTYTTLVNNQHSLARVPFAAAVFDEIRTLSRTPSACARKPPGA